MVCLHTSFGLETYLERSYKLHLIHHSTSSGTLEFPKESDHGIWAYAHKLHFSPDKVDVWVVSLFTVILVVVLDTSDYMRYIRIS